MLLLSALEPGFDQQQLQALEPGEHSALDRSERLAEPLGQLRLRQAAVVGELDRLSLVGRETAQRVLDDLAPRARDGGLVGSRAGRLRQRSLRARCGGAPRGGRGRPPAGGRTSAPRCSPSPARGGSSPAPRQTWRNASCTASSASAGSRRIAQRQAVGDTPEAVVELAERFLVGVGDGLEQRFVGKVRGVSPHVRPSPGGRARPYQRQCAIGLRTAADIVKPPPTGRGSAPVGACTPPSRSRVTATIAPVGTCARAGPAEQPPPPGKSPAGRGVFPSITQAS